MGQHHHHDHRQSAAGGGSVALEISLKNCHDAGDLAGIERLLSEAAGVRSVHIDRTRAIAHVTIDAQATSAEALHEALRLAGYGCVCQEAAVETPAGHRHAPDAHAGHGAHMVQDMLRRFLGSANLTVPIIL
jgi:Cu2+-exporting ATPase